MGQKKHEDYKSMCVYPLVLGTGANNILPHTMEPKY
jgi:hypothetical protein